MFLWLQAMKTYHQYQVESKTAEEALKKVQSQKAKIEQQLTGKTLSSSRKFKKIEKQEDEVRVCIAMVTDSLLSYELFEKKNVSNGTFNVPTFGSLYLT